MEREVIWYIPASYMGVIKEVKKYNYRTFPMPDPGPKENIAKVVEAVHPRVLATDMDELNKDYMKIARKYHVKVMVDEEDGTKEEWRKILNWGTDGIQTDHPAKLIEFLEAYNAEK
jgi:glycerophosphoryl diester phosphodiesterase